LRAQPVQPFHRFLDLPIDALEKKYMKFTNWAKFTELTKKETHRASLISRIAICDDFVKLYLFPFYDSRKVNVMEEIFDFRKKIKAFYWVHGRDLPWRHTRDPYRILISEIMLQQTQVSHVQTFYEKFIKRFPDFATLADARKSDVLRAWQGLGYNRRALALRELAGIVVKKYHGKLLRERASLEALPGIGSYTAGAIRAFAWNEPEIFIETNIRRVFLHFFFPRAKKVVDKKIIPLIEKTLDRKDPRAWYFALMDYGAMLGRTEKKNPNRRSAHYAKQAKFSGSDRELRGKILRLVLVRKRMSIGNLERAIPRSNDRIVTVLGTLSREGFIKKKGDIISA
jgi:A/G-specific adenine glycosylase